MSSERERERVREERERLREERERLKRMARDISKQLTVVTHRRLREGRMMRYVPRPLCVIIIDRLLKAGTYPSARYPVNFAQ